jgi:cellulose synthase/poly-beta-1,6-N-acetylglucosamine synthase-like glycosyltransferase
MSRVTLRDGAWKVYGVIGAAYWAFQAYSVFKVRQVPAIADMSADEDGDRPLVSVVMTARDEECEIEKALRSRLADDYPALELIVVDDRSTDSTPEIVDRLAAEDPRLRVVHVEELPEGWLGKVYAMSRGLAAAGGEWVLFSDADVRVKPGTLGRAMSWVTRSTPSSTSSSPLRAAWDSRGPRSGERATSALKRRWGWARSTS